MQDNWTKGGAPFTGNLQLIIYYGSEYHYQDTCKLVGLDTILLVHAMSFLARESSSELEMILWLPNSHALYDTTAIKCKIIK